MYNNSIYIILGVVAVIYIVISMNNRRIGKDRKSRRFMDGYERKAERKRDEDQK
ncbi:hypothetical protein Q4603_18180 [Zobellia galactanivorans]|uniref:Conserved hypothetical membrane protein n=1 Tax=Zobellia galactanivorans (strain DSM 12802 / CCUG 47099 / CIP 106680 / NCIMB 13871 / Dsij) TaxID=63186 RepID=G0KZP0_ZOBGA|nr:MULTISPECIES: hypothetical protein [Zobellia]MBU3025137.1 hypothetical protein [Zobellia galactanivorans]MDO6810556.1 hypothetical protein [Zobellia galactanivorans]CAZ97093.1 Conserved hypothetical membrane protein [Zobellia galactanivorans]